MATVRFAPLALAAVTWVSGSLAAQEFRTFEVARQVRDSAPLNTRIVYGAGTFTLAPAAGSDLYHMWMRYPAGATTPEATYNPTAHTLKLGMGSRTFSIPGDNADKNELRVGLARGVPLDLTLEIGAADAKARLGGLAIQKLVVKTGASDATIQFDSANTTHMDEMRLEVGAAGFQAKGLANARTNHISLRAGVGDFDLSFDGQWSGDITLDAKVALGSLDIHVPDDVRVEMNAKALLGAVTESNETATADDSASSDDDEDDSAAAAATHRAKAAKVAKAAPVPAKYTLHIAGGSTLGAIQVDHKFSGANR